MNACANLGTPISVYVATLIREAYGCTATVGTAAGVFRGAGIWLVNSKFMNHDFAPSTILQSDSAEGIEPPTAILPHQLLYGHFFPSPTAKSLLT